MVRGTTGVRPVLLWRADKGRLAADRPSGVTHNCTVVHGVVLAVVHVLRLAGRAHSEVPSAIASRDTQRGLALSPSHPPKPRGHSLPLTLPGQVGGLAKWGGGASYGTRIYLFTYLLVLCTSLGKEDHLQAVGLLVGYQHV